VADYELQVEEHPQEEEESNMGAPCIGIQPWEELVEPAGDMEPRIVNGHHAVPAVIAPPPSNEGSPIHADNGVYNFGDFAKLKIDQPQYIVEGLICERQNVLLMGRFGVGKTMLGAQLSLHLATGREFLGLGIPRPFRTMYLDFENDLGDMKSRVWKQKSSIALSKDEESRLDKNWIYVDGGDHDNPLHTTKLDTTPKDFESLTTLVAREEPQVLIIDNLGLVASKGDLKEAEDARRFYENLKILRSKADSLKNGAIIVFHHLTKPGEKGDAPISLLAAPYEYLSRARGSGRVLDFARTRLALAEEKVGPKVCHVVNGINRSAAMSPLILQFNTETLSFERHEDTKLRFEAVFDARPRGKDIYRQLPEEFTFSDAEKLRDQNTGKVFNKGTLSDTLKVAVSNDFIRHDPKTRVYKKVFDPQSN
jgi:hypothetical protein